MMGSVCVLEETRTVWGDKKHFNTLLTPALQILNIHTYEKYSGNKSKNWKLGLQIMEKFLHSKRKNQKAKRQLI